MAATTFHFSFLAVIDNESLPSPDANPNSNPSLPSPDANPKPESDPDHDRNATLTLSAQTGRQDRVLEKLKGRLERHGARSMVELSRHMLVRRFGLRWKKKARALGEGKGDRLQGLE